MYCSTYIHLKLIHYRASPRLKDAQLTLEESINLYVELILAVRKIFQQCKLVHADLSEYNILFHEGHLWIIDVSQSVEQDHPSAFDFLRKDLSNVEEFFGRLGVRCLGLRRVFEFVITNNLPRSSEALSDEDILRIWIEEGLNPENAASEDLESSAAHEDSVFKESYIPRTLNELFDPERDVATVNRGEGTKLIYAGTIGLVDPSTSTNDPERLQSSKSACANMSPTGGAVDKIETVSASESDKESDDSDNDTDSAGVYSERKPRGHRHEDREAKKVGLTPS